MTKLFLPSPTLAETAHGSRKTRAPLSRMMAGLTALAVGATVILVSSIPVRAERPVAACTLALTEQAVPACPAAP